MTSKGIISVFAFRKGGRSRKKGLGEEEKRARCDTMESRVPNLRHPPQSWEKKRCGASGTEHNTQAT